MMYMHYAEGVCAVCEQPKLIIYKAGRLCYSCNAKRLRARAKPVSRVSKRGRAVIKKDTEFYQSLWDTKPHFCEECRQFLGNEWQRIYFSHILTKGSYPRLRYETTNINILCGKHHQKWETGNRKDMRIYAKNQVTIQNLRDGHISV